MYLESAAGDVALDVAVLHVVDVAEDLELVVHGGDDGVEAVSDQRDLLVEFGVSGQRINGDGRELGEELEIARSFPEEPIYISR